MEKEWDWTKTGSQKAFKMNVNQLAQLVTLLADDSYLQSIYKMFKCCIYRIRTALQRSEAGTDSLDGSGADISYAGYH